MARPLVVGLLAWASVFLISPADSRGDQTADLSAAPRNGALQRVRLIAESEGVVRIKSPKVDSTKAENTAAAGATVNEDGVRELPMRTRGELTYDERWIQVEDHLRRSLRYHRDINAEVHVGKGEIPSAAPKEHRWTLAQSAPADNWIVSPDGPLTRPQLELLHPPLNSLAADRVLPNKSVAIGDSWPIEPESLAGLLDLDAVTQARVEARLKRIEKGLAVIEFAGQFSGALRGVACDFDIVGKANFHLDRRAVTWLAVSFDERRAIGHGEPGVNARTRVRMQILPIDHSPELADDAIAEIPLEPDDAQKLLRYRNQTNGFQVLLERDWRAMLQREDVSILRLVRNGDLVAQVNVSSLSQVESGKQVRLEAFRDEVAGALKAHQATLLDATEYGSPTGLQILRCSASGTIGGVPMQWIYYHATAESGRRVSYVFMVQQKQLERFGAADEEFTAALELLDQAPRVSRAIER